MDFGRRIIYTDEIEITAENISDVVRKAMADHEANVADIQYLTEYEAGHQKKTRNKTYRKDIDCWCVDNVANEITDFKLSFNWGNPITLAMRERNNSANNSISDGIFELNKYYDLQGYKSKQQQLARSVEICGIGYTYIDVNTDYEEGESPFTIDVLNPLCTFVIRSSYYIDRRVMVGVTYSCDTKGTKRYTCFTKDARYELSSRYEHMDRSGEGNPLNAIPIIEWIRSYDRLGCFERQISEMDNLNLLISDFTNDVEQNTQAIWHSNDVEFPKKVVENEDGSKTEVTVKPKGNDWMQTFTSRDGKTPFVEPLSINYDYAGMLNNIVTRRALILQKCNVPSRNDNSGGSTGVAMSDATGWTQAEAEATRQDQIKDVCKMEEVKVVLKAIRKSKLNPSSPVRTLTYGDIESHIPRQKTYELTTKINGLCALIAKGFALEDALSVAPLFEDNNQVLVRSGEGVRKFQEASVFKNDTDTEEKRPFADLSDQESNSPNIGGMQMGN